MFLDKPYNKITRPQSGHKRQVKSHCHLDSRRKRKVKMIIGNINSSYTYNKIIIWKPGFTELSEAYVMLKNQDKQKFKS